MESLLYSRHFLPIIITPSDALTGRYPVNPTQLRRLRVQVRPLSLVASSKNSDYRDFQDYAKPVRLLPTTEPKAFVAESPEKIIPSIQPDGSQSLYKVLLCTSSTYGSGLSDLNAGILICIIDVNGDSILERIPAILYHEHRQGSEDVVASGIHFQRGSTDEFVFWGPRLEKIQAMWISLESGRWRLGGACLTIISAHHQAEDFSENATHYCSVSYDFEVEDILLGEGGDMTMVELCPCLAIEHSGTNSSLLNTNVSKAKSLAEMGITNEDSMREYVNLKYSLLLYDAMLIFAGTSISSFTADEKTAIAFLIGGIGGFLYLLLLQRSVDGLPAPESVVMNNGRTFDRLFGGQKSPLLVFAFAVGFSVLLAKRGTVNVEEALTPREIMVGMVGFLACKISVLLAAFKPISLGMEDEK